MIIKASYVTSKLEDRFVVLVNNHQSTDEPFFSQDSNKVLFQCEIKNLQMPINLNISVQLLYKVIGDPDKEIYYKGWTIMKRHMLTIIPVLCTRRTRNASSDIGFQYVGLGHIRVLSCDLSITNYLSLRWGVQWL